MQFCRYHQPVPIAMNHLLRNHPRRRQHGVSTLLVAMLLLAILTIITLFAARYGVNEQRTSGNEYRYKMAFHVAEAGLAQSIEFFKGTSRQLVSTVSGGWLFDGDPHWEPCIVSFTGKVDPCDQLPDDVAAGSYRYIGPDAANQSGVLPVSDIAGVTDQVGGFKSSFKSYATLCRLDLTLPTNPTCSLSPSNEGTFYVTVVSVGTLDDENTTASTKQSFGTYRLLGRAPDAPLIAAGSIEAKGNVQIVPNPNAGGFGVPVSIWSSGNAIFGDEGSPSASPGSCHLSPWLANDGGKFGDDLDDNLLDGVCASCSCDQLCPETGGLISGKVANCTVADDNALEGEDILDVDGFSEASPKLKDSKTFPADLFAYVFGVPDSDAVDYLKKNALEIPNCSDLGPDSTGLYWVTGPGAACKLGANVGSVQNPVVVVSDVPVDTVAGGQFFGIVFVRSVATATGGDLISANGGAQFYGSIILQGAGRLGGNPQIIYNRAVLQNVLNAPAFLRYAVIPGSWSDTIEQN